MTRKSDHQATDFRALNALTRLGREAVDEPTPAELERGLSSLLGRLAPRQSGRITARWALVAMLGAFCAFLGFQVASVVRERFREVPPLAYRVEGGSVLEGGYLRDSGSGGVRLFFNEGTKVTLTPSARGRLRSVDKDGTRVVLDQGTASFDVARSKERRWLVEAGPFSVAVKGTFFTVSWAPAIERFELRLLHGSVVVSGPMASGDIELRAGQRLVVNLPKAETLITEEKAEEVHDAPSNAPSTPNPDHDLSVAGVGGGSPGPKNAPGSSSSAALSAPSPSSRGERKLPWADQMANGHWDRILDEVDRAGLDATLENATSADLFALADAARYRRRTDLARAALLAQRRRFPSSARSLDAAFLLGRVEESRDRARAIGWYNEYLERAATGTYAAEAWGRKMVLTNELKGRALARPIAEEYLRRFPKGSYAGSARALCREP